MCSWRRSSFLDFPKFLRDAAEGHAHHVEIAAFDSDYKFPAEPLDRITARLAERLAGGHVIGNFLDAQLCKVNARYVDKYALDAIGQLRARSERAGVAGNREYNNGWHTTIDVGNMMMVSEAITRAALLRKESRGAQFREDFPGKDSEWGKYNIVIRRGADGEMQVEKRALTAMPDELKAVVEEMK